MTTSEQWDVAVVGAGPAGATAALHLARRGLRVALVDRHRFPRDKVCGDALIPDAIHALERCGLYDTVRAHGITMCGYIPTTVALGAARALGATRATVVGYATSADAGGDPDRVVGYAAVRVDA